MSNASETSAPARGWGRSVGSPSLLVLAVYTPLALYLFRATQHTGDGAAYTLQAADGAALDRAVHGGWLVPLSAWARLLELLGVDPSAATNAASLLVLGLGLLALRALGSELASTLGGRQLDGVLAPATALCASAVWDAATFCEIYGPLASLLILAVLAVRREHITAGAVAGFLAIATHPGAVALLPGLVVLARRDRGWSAPLRATGGAVLLAGAWVLAVGPDAWLGPRGVTAGGADVTPWTAAQRAWRLLARDLGISALPLLVGAITTWDRRHPDGVRWLTGCGLLFLGTVTGLDRFSDNPATLPLFLLCCPLAAVAPSGLRRLPLRSAQASGWLMVTVLALGIAEATTRQDVVARRAVRDQEARAADCAQDGSTPWRERMLTTLACRP